MGTLASVLPGPGPHQKPQLTRAEGNLSGAGTAATGNRYERCGLWVPGLGPGPRHSLGFLLFPASMGSLPAPSPEVSSCSLCRKNSDATAGPLPVFHSCLPLFSAELFLNSLSQPFSLEEQEQILSCLSVDSLSLSDDSEKVSQPWTRGQDAEQVALCPAGHGLCASRG